MPGYAVQKRPTLTGGEWHTVDGLDGIASREEAIAQAERLDNVRGIFEVRVTNSRGAVIWKSGD